MSWMPTFLNLPTALIAAAIALPTLILLYFLKLRRRELAISSTLLWKRAIADLQVNAPFQKLRRNLLLLLQLLLLIALLLALARPVVNMPAAGGDLMVLLIDRSASMNARDDDGQTRLQIAKDRAKQRIDLMGRGASAAVIAFDDTAETIAPFTTDAAALRRAIDSIEPTDRPSRLKLAYQLAEAQSAFNENQLRAIVRPSVWLFSDGRVLDAEQLRLSGDLYFEPIGQSQTPNIAIVALSARRDYQHPEQVQVFARLTNYGNTVVKPDVQLSVATIDPASPGDLRFVKTRLASTVLLPQRAAQNQQPADEAGEANRDSVEFTLDLPTAAVIRVEQLLAQDRGLAADDLAQVILPPPKRLRVALITEGNYFLQKALAALPLDQPATMTPSQYQAAFADGSISDFDVLIFDRYAPANESNRSTMPEAGNFIFFGQLPDNLTLTAARENSTPVNISDMQILDWKRDHPMLRGLSLGRIVIGQAMQLRPGPQTEVLVDGTKGPLIVLHREGRRVYLVVGFDLLESNWPLRVSFPVFMQNAMQYLALGAQMNARQSFSPGATPTIPRSAIQQVGDEAIKSITLRGPDGARSVAIPPGGDFALPPLNQVGIYSTEPPVPQFEHLAVNLLDDNESNLTVAAEAPGNIGQRIDGGEGHRQADLWWWIIACVGLPMLLIEWWVYTRRVHL